MSLMTLHTRTAEGRNCYRRTRECCELHIFLCAKLLFNFFAVQGLSVM